jgi:hypothetical protein
MDDQPQRVTQPQQAHLDSGSWRSRIFAAVFIFALLGGILIYRVTRERTTDSAPPEGAEDVTSGVAAVAPESPNRNPQPKVSLPPNRVLARPLPAQAATLPASSLISKEIIERLFQIQTNQGQISPEHADQLRQSFAELAGQGTAAVPAIRQFLEGNQDLSFEESSGASAVGYSSVRAGLFDVLRQIGGPETTDTFLNTLRATADPSEIALIGRYLEEQAPGQNRQEVVTAARETLHQAARGQLPVREAAPLFQVLQAHGDASVIADLELAMPQWSYYATMALAGLPEGQGVSTLAQRVKESADGSKAPNTFVLQMLAQSAGDHPDAAAALIEQARLNLISDRAWVKIAEGLAGDQYHLGQPATGGVNPEVPPAGLKTYHIESGNQNFYSLPFNASGTPDQAAQRRALIDQLLGTTLNPAAMQALQNARSALSPP